VNECGCHLEFREQLLVTSDQKFAKNIANSVGRIIATRIFKAVKEDSNKMLWQGNRQADPRSVGENWLMSIAAHVCVMSTETEVAEGI